jgi:hypothetical protein
VIAAFIAWFMGLFAAQGLFAPHLTAITTAKNIGNSSSRQATVCPCHALRHFIHRIFVALDSADANAMIMKVRFD